MIGQRRLPRKDLQQQQEDGRRTGETLELGTLTADSKGAHVMAPPVMDAVIQHSKHGSRSKHRVQKRRKTPYNGNMSRLKPWQDLPMAADSTLSTAMLAAAQEAKAGSVLQDDAENPKQDQKTDESAENSQVVKVGQMLIEE